VGSPRPGRRSDETGGILKRRLEIDAVGVALQAHQDERSQSAIFRSQHVELVVAPDENQRLDARKEQIDEAAKLS
jgi:hypothetical protein